MNFTSIAFYILFLITISSMFFIEKLKKENSLKIHTVLLSVLSLIFCGWQDWRFALIILLEAIFVYFIALKVDETKSKLYVGIGVTVTLCLLGVFKYYNFFADTFNIFGIPLKRMELFLPIGISFYTFSSIGYIIDVYRKKYSAEKEFFNVLLYMSFFPKVTAGPIISFDKFLEQLKDPKCRINKENLSAGIQIIMMGLVKKNVLSDHISVFVNAVYDNVNMYNAPTLLLAVFAYGIQIYLDFSGYSDIAVGCARCLGFVMPMNFNLPYLSRNITEFWKRWHITLSNWLMTYLYISLGGNRNGYIRTLANLLITMAIGGLWHGASWNFVLWGVFHGLALCVHKHFMKLRNITKDYIPSLPGYITGVIATYLFANFCWIFFRITDIKVIGQLLYRIVTFSDGVAFYSTWAIIGIVLTLAATIIVIIKNIKESPEDDKSYSKIQGFYICLDLSKFGNLVIFFVIAGLILGFAYANSSPFIYAAF